MRLKRNQSRLSFRASHRNGGGFSPYWVVLALLALAGFASRDMWLSWLRGQANTQEEATLSEAQRAFSQGDYTTAIAIAQARYGAQPTDTDALILLVRSLIYRSYTDFHYEPDRITALNLTTEAMVSSNQAREVLAIHALALQANRRSEEASRVALRAIDRDKESIVARLALALSYSSTGLFEAGLREAERAVGITQTTAPEWAWDALRVKAIALSDLGRYQDAINTADEALNVNRRMIFTHFEKALYALQLGQADVATAAYFNVIALDANNVKARFRLCELSSSMSERASAVRYCSEVTDRRPEWSEGWYKLGREYFLQGDFRLAQQALNRCSTLQITSGVPISERKLECWILQGQAAEIMGDCPNLLATYNEFLVMVVNASLPQTWVYPPEGPSICLAPTTTP